MNARLGRTLAFSFCILSQASYFPPPDSNSVDVHVESGEFNNVTDQAPILVTLHQNEPNRSTDVVVELWCAGKLKANRKIGTLEPGQSWAESFHLPSPNGHYLLIKYKNSGASNLIARAIPEIPKKPSGLSISALPAISSLIGAIIGAWLLHSFSTRRERNRAGFEWGKMVFEKYEKPYRYFLRRWNASTSSSILETEFEDLQNEALVSQEIKQSYRTTLQILRNGTSSESERQTACETLYRVIESFFREAPK
jgi:hypothetical protein